MNRRTQRTRRGEWKAVGTMLLLVLVIIGMIVASFFTRDRDESAGDTPVQFRHWI